MQDFVGFRFGNVHSKDLHLLVVSSSNRYDKNLLPDPSDSTTSIPGGDGDYYFGQTFKQRTFSLNVAFDSVSEEIFRQISQLFATDKEQDLVFDELPYKTYRAKLKSSPDFKFVCFTDYDTGERVYKGEGTLTFIAYFPFAYGFNKYVVRAADFYKCTMPQHIITRELEDNPYRDNRKKVKFLQKTIKDHYNVAPNMNTPWKGGYPSIEQVQWGELYFKDEHSYDNKIIIDTRDYWKNIPEWEGTAKLLTTPTLDYDRELIYMPQYSKVNYYNMDTGLNRQNGLIGSRILVYNPGDVPVEFELRLGNLSSQFRKNLDNYTFRVSRYNVQRLTIEQAVDWTGLQTYDISDNRDYKYGNRYFTILEPNSKNSSIDVDEVKETLKNANIEGGAEGNYSDLVSWDFEPVYRHLKKSHPHHAYIVEPIPRDQLGYFIKLFYWQSLHLSSICAEQILNMEEGIEYANRYEELLAGCITEDEKNELYWITLKEAILSKYELLNEWLIYNKDKLGEDYTFFNMDYTYEDFLQEYLYNPPEYIRNRDDLDYGQFLLNLSRLPSYYTYDYFDITSEGFDKIPAACCACDDCTCYDDLNRKFVQPLFLDSDKRMLYNLSEPVWKNDRSETNKKWQEENEDLMSNFFDFKPTKNILNDNIIRGHWFKLPPGWSLIDISPVIDEDLWGGKRWLDGRPFNWGTNDEKFRAWFNEIYKKTADEYLSQKCPENVMQRYGAIYDTEGKSLNTDAKTRKEFFESLPLFEVEEYMQFRKWYTEENGTIEPNKTTFYGNLNDGLYCDWDKDEDDISTTRKDTVLGFGYELTKKRTEDAEYGFLKLLDNYWRINNLDVNGQPQGGIDDWWWYANDYIWANFPPLYWGYADLLNQLQIKYVPLFY